MNQSKNILTNVIFQGTATFYNTMGKKTNMLYTTVIIRTVPIWKSHRQLYIYLGVLLTVFAILNMIIIIIQFQNHILYLFQTFLNFIFSLSKFSDFCDFSATKQYKSFRKKVKISNAKTSAEEHNPYRQNSISHSYNWKQI